MLSIDQKVFFACHMLIFRGGNTQILEGHKIHLPYSLSQILHPAISFNCQDLLPKHRYFYHL